MDQSLFAALLNIGLHDKEARVYLALLELGEAPIAEIAKRAELKRTIVYVVIGDLMKHGYASEVLGKKVRSFVAADPLKFVQNIQTHVEDLRFLLPAFRALQKQGVGKPKIEIFEGKEGVLSVYRMFDHEKGTLRFLSNMTRLKQIFPKEVDHWIRSIAARTIIKDGQKLLVADDAFGKEYGKIIAKTPGHLARLLPKDVFADMDFEITGGKLGITNFDPLYIVLIHSESIAKSAAALFDLAWKQGRQIK